MSSDKALDAGPLAGVCAVAPDDGERVVLGHGSGGRLSHRLLEQLIYPAFANPILDRRDDQAVVELTGRVAYTTDSFVVTPLFFPGGDIGKLAIHGTVNDLAMAGAVPRYLSVSLILEEGLAMATLARVIESMRAAAGACKVSVVTGDTKVVGRGAADQLFINTSGLGVVPPGLALSCDRARAGDAVIVSGTLGDHGMAVMAAREDLGFGDGLCSDSAPLHELVRTLLDSGAEVHCLRDPTRGGLAASLTEIAARSRIGVVIDEVSVPVTDSVRGMTELLGLDPLYVANEGKLVAFVAAADAPRALAALRSHPLGKDAAIIGEATPSAAPEIVLRTRVGGLRLVELPTSDPLPRIC